MQNENTEIRAMSPDLIRDYTNAFKGLATELVAGSSLPKGIKTAGDFIMYMQAGRDLGITLTEALNSLAFINWKMTMYWPKLIARARQFGYKFKFDEWTEEIKKIQEDGSEKMNYNKYCTCTMWHKDSPEDVRTERRDLIKANKAGLLGKDVWKNYTETMLRYRAIGDCIKFFAPEAMSGVSMYEEVRDYSVENSDYQVVEPKRESSLVQVWIIEGDTMDWFANFVDAGTPDETETIQTEEPQEVVEARQFEAGDIITYKKKQYKLEEIMEDKVILESEDGEIITADLSKIKFA